MVESGQPVVLGAPFDWGTSFRPGTRFGPQAIRNADYLPPDGTRPHLSAGIDPLLELSVVDAGDVPVVRGYIEPSLELLEQYVYEVARRGAIPVILGGDHTVTLANGTGIARHYGYGNVAVIHFDAHADTGIHPVQPELLGHGVAMRRLIESGAVPGNRFVQIGLRGYWPGPEVFQWMRDQGIRSFFMDEVNRRGLPNVLTEAIESVCGDSTPPALGVFVSIDVDVVDPGMAPGTGTPEPGGLTSRQILDAVRTLGRDLPVVGMDVVEVSPPYDQPANITALLAHRIVLETLTGIAERRHATSNL